jgi:hypothetical protein
MTIEEKIDLLLEQHEKQRKAIVNLSTLIFAIHHFFTCVHYNKSEEMKCNFFDTMQTAYNNILENLGVNQEDDEETEIHAFSKDGHKVFDESQVPELIKWINDK